MRDPTQSLPRRAGPWSRRYAVGFFLCSFSLSSKKGRKEGQGSALDPVEVEKNPLGLWVCFAWPAALS